MAFDGPSEKQSGMNNVFFGYHILDAEIDGAKVQVFSPTIIIREDYAGGEQQELIFSCDKFLKTKDEVLKAVEGIKNLMIDTLSNGDPIKFQNPKPHDVN